jgi:phosphatidate cytidylyltransferase
MSPFLSRVAVVAAGLPIVLGSAYLGGWFLVALTAVGGLVALHEFYRLARTLRPLVLAGYGGAVAALIGAELGGPAWMLGGYMLTFGLAFVFAAVSETRQSTTVAIAATVFAAGWIGLGLGHLILIRALDPAGRLGLITVLLVVFAADSAAYLMGRFAGRHRMSPVVSPGKTWEGFAAGVVAGVFTSFLALYHQDLFDETWRALVLGAVVVVAATLGDLFESLVKRDFGAKDAGRILFAHGGVLDRIDALLFAGPAAYFTLLALR